jgi:hypothetical protein
VIPFDQREISVIIEHDFCFATLENRVYSSASTAESALNPLISRDPTWTAGRDFAIENGRNAGG